MLIHIKIAVIREIAKVTEKGDMPDNTEMNIFVKSLRWLNWQKRLKQQRWGNDYDNVMTMMTTITVITLRL